MKVPIWFSIVLHCTGLVRTIWYHGWDISSKIKDDHLTMRLFFCWKSLNITELLPHASWACRGVLVLHEAKQQAGENRVAWMVRTVLEAVPSHVVEVAVKKKKPPANFCLWCNIAWASCCAAKHLSDSSLSPTRCVRHKHSSPERITTAFPEPSSSWEDLGVGLDIRGVNSVWWEEAIAPDTVAWWRFVTVGLMKGLGLRFSSQVENKDWGKIKKKPRNGNTAETNCWRSLLCVKAG